MKRKQTKKENSMMKNEDRGIFWEDAPAREWLEAYPIGNGRQGAMIYGGCGYERVQLNLDSLWYGGHVDRINPEARENLKSVRQLILNGRISEAEELQDGLPSYQRDGEWTFLKGYICYSRGWLDQAVSYFQTACQQDPGNQEYRNALNQLMWQQQTGFPRGGYQTMGGAGCSVCDLCVALWCTDCLCSFCH